MNKAKTGESEDYICIEGITVMKLLNCTYFVRRPGAHWRSIDINTWFLSHVDPDDWSLLGVVLG